MKSSIGDILPGRLRRSLAKVGSDIALARRKRNLTAKMMSERLGVARSTYLRIERGDPTVAMGAYAMAFFVLGVDDAFGKVVDPGADDVGLLLDAQRLPKRVRPRKEPTAL